MATKQLLFFLIYIFCLHKKYTYYIQGPFITLKYHCIVTWSCKQLEIVEQLVHEEYTFIIK